MEPTDPQAHHLPAAHPSLGGPFVINRDLNRADRRALAGHGTQPPRDLLMMRLGVWVYIGIAGGGRVRLTIDEARSAATALEGLTDIAELDQEAGGQ